MVALAFESQETSINALPRAGTQPMQSATLAPTTRRLPRDPRAAFATARTLETNDTSPNTCTGNLLSLLWDLLPMPLRPLPEK